MLVSRRCIPEGAHLAEARLAAHVQVEQQDVGAQLAQRRERRLDVRGLGHDVDVGVGGEQRAQPAAHDRMVIRHHDARRLRAHEVTVPRRPRPRQWRG